MKLQTALYGAAGLLGLGAVAFILYQVRDLTSGPSAPEIPDQVFSWLWPDRLTLGEVAGYAYCWKLVEIGAIPPAQYAAPPAAWSAAYLEWTDALLDALEVHCWILYHFTTIHSEGLWAELSRAQAEEVLGCIHDVWGWAVPTPSWA